MEYLNYAKRLKELQSDKGIKTQIELSAWMGFSKSIVSAWMRGEKIPSMDTALKIAEMFDVRVEWLLTGKGSKRITDAPQLQNYINVSNLTSDQRALINQMINQFAPKSSENKENKPLTPRPENGGGGVNLPDPLASYHRRQGDEPADKEFIEAVQHDYEDSK